MTEEEIRRKAAKRVEDKKGFYAHLISYGIIMAFLAILNLITSPHSIWVIYPALGWGVGLAFHYFAVYGLLSENTTDWEEKEMEKEVRRLKKLKNITVEKEDTLDLDDEGLKLRKLKEKRIDWDDKDLV